MKTITAFASSKNGLEEIYYTQTNRLMNLLDPEKITLVYGGGHIGIMACIRTFTGKVISSNLYKFADSLLPKDDYLFETIEERQHKMVEMGEMYLILPGGYGTHYEALEVMTKNDIGQTNKPIFMLNVNGIFDLFLQHIDDLNKKGFLQNVSFLYFYVSSDPEELAQMIHKHC